MVLKKTVKRILFVVLFCIAFFIVLMKINFLDYEKPKPYSKIKEITFKNFRGLEFFQNSLYGNKSFAYVYTTINYEFDGDSLSVQSFFHPSRSYVYNKKAYSKDLLIHEMYHFKITELYARIAKERISEIGYLTKDKIKNIIATAKKEEQGFQNRYDDDTFHSYVLGQQKKYEKDIDSLLTLYEKFKKPNIYLNEQ